MTLALAPAVHDTLDGTVTEQLEHHYHQVELAARDMLTHALAAGRILHQAKLNLDHGQWSPWLDEHFPGSNRTAQAWMQLARAERETPELLTTIGENPTVAAALKAIAAPASGPAKSTPKGRTVTLDPDVENYILTIQQLQALVASFGGHAPLDRIRRWIERLTEPKMILCPDCGDRVQEVIVDGCPIRTSPYPWQPATTCTKCLQTRNAHPGRPVSCVHCNSTGSVGEADRPPGHVLAADEAWSDTPRYRVIGPRTDRRKGEAIFPLHQCPAPQQEAA